MQTGIAVCKYNKFHFWHGACYLLITSSPHQTTSPKASSTNNYNDMKSKNKLITTILSSSLLAAAPFAHAVSGNWNPNNSGNWSDAANWSSNPIVPGTAAGDIISLINDINSTRTITMNTTSRTAGVLNIGDSNNTHRFALNSSGGAFLTLNNSGSPAQINETGSQIDNINVNITLADNLALSSTGELHISGVISQSGGAKTITKTGAGLVNLIGANSYTGVVNINAGTLGYQHATAGGTTAGNTIVATGATAYITTQLPTGFNEAFNISGIGVGGFGALRVGGGATTNFGGSVTLSGDSRIGTDGSAQVSFNGGIDTGGFTLTLAPTGPSLTVATTAISGSGSIIKSTTAAVTFSAANTYTGSTTVSSGTLSLTGAGSIANSSSIIVNSTLSVSGITPTIFTVGAAQSLSGSGSITAGAKTVEIAGTHGPGNGLGTQSVTAASLTYASGSIFNWDLAANSNSGRGTNYDGLTVTGNLNTSAATFRVVQNTGVNFANSFWDTDKSWTDIFSVSGTTTGWTAATPVNIFTASNTPVDVSATRGTFTITGTTLNWTAVPEASNLLIGGLLGLGMMSRRRKQA